MSKEEFAELVKEMRDIQKEYFTTRNRGVLAKAIASEKAVDKEVTLILGAEKKVTENKIPNPGFIW